MERERREGGWLRVLFDQDESYLNNASVLCVANLKPKVFLLCLETEMRICKLVNGRYCDTRKPKLSS